MKLKSTRSIFISILLTTAVFVIYNAGTSPVTGATTLTAYQVDSDIVLDGVGDDAGWTNADAISYSTDNINLKFVHNGTHLFFLATWDDATENSNRKGWAWNPTTETYDNLGGNEDRFAIAWANQTTGMTCGHVDSSTTETGMLFDVWHWKATRTEPAGYADDKWWDASGRNSDAKSAGGYKDNSVVKQAVDATEITNKLGNTTNVAAFGAGDLPYWFDNGTEITWSSGAVTGTMPTAIGGYKTAMAIGSRGDVKTSAMYGGGGWTLEGVRAFNTGNSADDVTFAEKGSFDFWIAKMDNSGSSHVASTANMETLYIAEGPKPVTDTVTVTPDPVTDTVTVTSVDTTTATADTVTVNNTEKITVTETPDAVTNNVTLTTTTTEAGYNGIYVTLMTLFTFMILVYRKRR